ncbi:GlxA family transcriptional regulator [uncultured Litoreibacter sp.]|uniref:GlxA family transcriptional regulator n=1 Tax=uncultured Litoreibacter sp. TaxID=1392394 RepID=UPI002626D7A5|nr:helix-turn-helix domain-containing protein [uncultured Litoreibacter sp.]
MTKSNFRTYKVATLGLDGSVASSISGPADLFAAANVARASAPLELKESLPRFEWCLAADTIVASHSGLEFSPTATLADITKYDLVIVPGFGSFDPQSRLDVLASSADVIKKLEELRTERTTILGLCTGTILLAEAGLLDGRSATTSWWNAAEFARSYPLVDLNQSQLIVHEGNIISAGAGAAYFDAILYLLDRLAGPWLAETVAKYFVLDQRRTSQAEYVLPSFMAHSDKVITSADRWLRERLADKEPIPLLASHLGMSQRSLHRHFIRILGISPQRYALSLRMSHARMMLQNGSESVETISGQVGYVDANSFRRAFKTFFGKNTSAYR